MSGTRRLFAAAPSMPAVEASANLKVRNLEREAADLPFADVDIALHVGEVLYGNVGAVDRLDFTVIGPTVNEVVRMEKLCEPLGQQILFSSRFAEAAGRCDGRLSRSDIFNCVASMRPRRFLDCGSPRPSFCNA